MPQSLLLEILESRSATTLLRSTPKPESVSSQMPSFPFLAIVGQVEMKTALLLSVINPGVGGVLLIGPRGTGKTTAVRGLVELMPPVRRSEFITQYFEAARAEEKEIQVTGRNLVEQG
jgi:magnesium chelatase subunit I